MKKIPIGVDDFKKIRTRDYYYIDKTRFAEEIMKDGAEIKLFTRPRRFGKTINMSMLRYFFDIKNKEENRKLFDGLYIENTPLMEEQGKYPVIFISMKGISCLSWEESLKELRSKISELFDEYKDIKDSLTERDLAKYKKIWYEEPDADYRGSLIFLTKILNNYYNQPVILLIDEYDAPLIAAYEHGYYYDAVNFFKNFYGSVLKTNPHLKMGVMTGIIRVAQAGIFSDLNNLKVNTILNESYSDCFGLLEKEVEEALNYYGLEYNMAEVKNWYDGYRFGKKELYNPWSIINYLSSRKLGAYWINTSGNYLIKDILRYADGMLFDRLNILLSGGKIEESVTGRSSLGDVLNAHDVWELLLFSGYLTIDEVIDEEEDIYSIRIPNKEIRKFFRNSFIEVAFGSSALFRNLVMCLLENRIPEFERTLQEILLKYMSFNDTSTIEKVYHNFILGLMIHLDGEYEIKSNLESGYGRYDMVLEPLNRSRRAFVLEFKTASSEKKLESKAEEGLQQIEEKKYYLTLKEKGLTQITLLGMAFHKKLVRIRYKEI